MIIYASIGAVRKSLVELLRSLNLLPRKCSSAKDLCLGMESYKYFSSCSCRLGCCGRTLARCLWLLDTLNKDGNVKTLPLFADIKICTQQYLQLPTRSFLPHNFPGSLWLSPRRQHLMTCTRRVLFGATPPSHSLGEYSHRSPTFYTFHRLLPRYHDAERNRVRLSEQIEPCLARDSLRVANA
jgi:hypothetical protein